MTRNKPNMLVTLTVPKAKKLTPATVRTEQENSQPLCSPHEFEKWFEIFQTTAAANYQKDLERKAKAKKEGRSCK